MLKVKLDEVHVPVTKVPITIFVLSILRDKAVQTVLKHYVAFDLGLHCLPFIQQFFNYMIR